MRKIVMLFYACVEFVKYSGITLLSTKYFIGSFPSETICLLQQSTYPSALDEQLAAGSLRPWRASRSRTCHVSWRSVESRYLAARSSRPPVSSRYVDSGILAVRLRIYVSVSAIRDATTKWRVRVFGPVDGETSTRVDSSRSASSGSGSFFDESCQKNNCCPNSGMQ